MHIVYVSQYFPPEPGAPAARVSELSRAWAARGHKVTVLTGMPHHPAGVIPPEYRGRALVRERFHDVDVVRTWIYAAANKGKVRRSLAFLSYAASAAAWGQLHVDAPDVVVATSPQLLSAAAGSVLSLTRGAPWVFEVRDLWPESIVAVGALPARHPVVRGLEVVEEGLYRRADRVVVVTDAFRERLIERGLPASKLAVMKNGADLSRFVPRGRDTPLRAELGWQGKTVVSYAGTHGMAHGLDAILDVAKGLRGRGDLRFLFVGDGAQREALTKRVEREAITNVKLLGPVPRDRMTEVYATSDVCLVPLRATALFNTVLPSKLFEIMAMERPVVLSVDGEARALTEASGAGLYAPPEDVPAITEALVALADDPARREAMGRSGRAFVTAHYDREQIAGRYLALLEDLARERRRR